MKSQEKLPRAMADYGKRFEQGLEQMSPFEIKNDLISYCLLYTSPSPRD